MILANFDEHGDLWVPVDLNSVPEDSSGLQLLAVATFEANGNGSFGVASTKLNLTAYIKSKMQPNWLNSAITTSSAKITVNGDAISQ